MVEHLGGVLTAAHELADLQKAEVRAVPEAHDLPLPIGQPADRDQQLGEEDPVLGDLRRIGTGAEASADLLLNPVPDAGPAYRKYQGEVASEWESSLADLKKYLEGPRRRRILIEAGLPEN